MTVNAIASAGKSGTRGLLAGFILVIGLMLASAGIGIVYLGSLNETIADIVEQHNERSRLASEMYIASRERALQLHTILQESDPFARDALVPHFYELAGRFRRARARLLTLNLSAEERQILAEQASLTAQGSVLQDQVLDLALADQQQAAEHLLVTEVSARQGEVAAHLRRFLDRQVTAWRAAAADAREEYLLARTLMLFAVLAMTLLAGVIAVRVIRAQTRLLASLQAREHEAAVLLESIPVPVWFKDLSGRIVRCNPAFARIAGLSVDVVLGQQESDIWDASEGQHCDLEDRKVLETGQMRRQDRRFSAHGREVHLLIARTPISTDDARGWRGVLCVANDLTALERMNDLLETTNMELQAQKTAMDEHAIVSIADTDGVITYVNDKFCAISGYAREELLGQSHHVVNSEQHPIEYFDGMWQTITAGQVWHGEICNRRKDGSFYWVDSTIVPFLGLDGAPTQYIGIRTDISARKEMERSLQDINLELQRRVDERTAALSLAKQQLEADIDERKRSQALLKQQYQQLEGLHRELQDAQSQLLQSEKLASIGQLAAGMAHEINNPIGFVQSNLGTLENYIRDLFTIIQAYETCEASLPPEITPHGDVVNLKRQLDLAYLKTDIPALLSESREGIARVRKIVQDLKDFSRLDSSPDWQYADLHQGIESTLNIVQNEIKYRADVVKEYGEIPAIECLPSQLNQVFMNLLVNAAHAIEGPRGSITLRTGCVAATANEADNSATDNNHEADCKAVWIEVVDTGKGIPAELVSRIFDPFFTTKAVGKGTGLGLSLAYGIIQKHNGRIEVTSEVGKGSTFRITLPVAQREKLDAA
jgi:two-component system, NtrC family, sensor kinase